MIDCLIKLEVDDTRADAKMDLMEISSALMPAGQPRLLDVVRYPMIKDLAKQHGRKNLLKAIYLMVKDFCASMNVVRNMNEDQMIEAAAMLLDECDNFRMEDYLMMFTLAKRGKVGRIMDRIDLQVIAQILDEYWRQRLEAGRRFQEEGVDHIDSLGSTLTEKDKMHPMDAQLSEKAGRLASAVSDLKNQLTEWKKNGESEPL